MYTIVCHVVLKSGQVTAVQRFFIFSEIQEVGSRVDIQVNHTEPNYVLRCWIYTIFTTRRVLPNIFMSHQKMDA